MSLKYKDMKLMDRTSPLARAVDNLSQDHGTRSRGGSVEVLVEGSGAVTNQELVYQPWVQESFNIPASAPSIRKYERKYPIDYTERIKDQPSRLPYRDCSDLYTFIIFPFLDKLQSTSYISYSTFP